MTHHASSTRIKDAYERRKQMLQSLKGDIRAALYDTLAKKIEYEHDSLHDMLAREAVRVEQTQREVKVLSSEFFIKKRLDISML